MKAVIAAAICAAQAELEAAETDYFEDAEAA